MSTIEQQARIDLSLNAQKAMNKLKELEKQADELNKTLDETEKGTKRYEKLEKQLSAVKKNIQKVKQTAFDVNKVLDNLSGASIKDINKAIKEMNRQMDDMDRNSDKWRYYKQQIERAKEELRSINAEGKKTESWLSRMNSKFNQWGAGVATFIAAMTGVTLTIQKFRNMAVEKESAQANLKALTGLDDQAIAWLTRQAEQLSTSMESSGLRVRQSAQEILDAYTLVGSAKPELLTDKEALNAVTIEAMRLAEAARMDLKEAVDAVTLSMNQYGATAEEVSRYTNVMAAGSKYGSAAVQSITVAVKNSGVAAAAANIPIEQLVGSIETLAEKGIKDEVAGTGLKTFFLKLEGLDEEFRPSVVGLQKALENLNAKGMGTQEMLATFQQEAYTVAQAMISNADKVKYYTEAVTGTNVAMEQAAINSNTTAARMAQARNRIQEVGIELGQRLSPLVISTAKTTTLLMEAFVALIDACEKYKTSIIAMATTMTALIALKKADVLWTQAQALWTGKVTVAVKTFFTVVKANPMGVAIAAVSALVGVLAQLADRVNFAKDSQKRMNEAMQESQSAAVSEIRRLAELKGELSTLKEGTEQYNTVKQKIIDGYAQYYDGLQDEIDKVGLTTEAYNKLTEAITKSYGARQYEKFAAEQQTALDEELTDILNKIKERTKKELGPDRGSAAFSMIRDAILQGQISSVARYGGYGTELRGINDTLQTYLDEMSGVKDAKWWSVIDRQIEIWMNDAVWLLKDFEKADKEARELFGIKDIQVEEDNSGNETQDMSGSKTSVTVKNKEYWEGKKKEAEDKLAALDIAKKGTEEWNKLVREVEEAEANIANYSTSKLKAAELKDYKKELNDFENEIREKRTLIESAARAEQVAKQTEYLQGKISQEQYSKDILAIEIKALEEKQKLYEKGSKEWQLIEDEKSVATEKNNQRLLDIQKKHEEEMQKIKEKYEKDYEQFREQYIKKSDNEKMTEELALLDEYNKLKLVKTEDYEILRQGIIEKYTKGNKDILFEDLEDIAKFTEQAWSYVSALMNAGSELIQANMDLEIAKINQRYDTQLERAEGNEAETKKIESRKEAEIARVKNEYNKRAMKMQMAQLLATSAMGMLNAWVSAMKIEPAFLIPVYGGIFSGIIAAQTAIQVAALKKQHEAQAAGYYSGGYTSRTAKDTDEAGVVHGNEFVVNARGVRNPAVRPVLDFIDRAQRNNYISSITPADVAMAAGIVKNNTTIINNTADRELMTQFVSIATKLSRQLDKPIVAQTYITGKGGSEDAQKMYNKMITNAER